jgi:hypothetical protein
LAGPSRATGACRAPLRLAFNTTTRRPTTTPWSATWSASPTYWPTESEAPPPYPEDHTASFQKLGVDELLERRICQAVSARFAKVLELFGL